jgi:uncharacterized membrane protein
LSSPAVALVIAIMVLELKVPHAAAIDAVITLWPVFVGYVLSFVYVGIYWNKLQYGNYPSKHATQRWMGPA